MLKLHPRCKVCIAIKQNKRLMERIYNSSFYISHSTDSLMKIHADCQAEGVDFNYDALRNHAKKHQHLNAADYQKKMMHRAAKKAEVAILNDRYTPQQAQDAVINKGMEQLEKGEMTIKADHMLRAAKDKQDAQAKIRDQQLQLAEMVAFYASGEDNYKPEVMHDRRRITVEDYDPSIPIT